MVVLAPCLIQLRNELNQLNAKRDRTSDGWIGDRRHSSTKSDHNPDASGVVHAIDVDKDGLNVNLIVGLIVNRCMSGAENRLKYIIWNRTIWSAVAGWKPRRYLGTNPHTHHFHVSGKYSTGAENDTRPWGVLPAAPVLVKPPSALSTAYKPGSRTLYLRRSRFGGEDVRFVQRWLGLIADGIYSASLALAVKEYQRMRGITADGVVGPNTWRQMGVKFTG